MKNLTKILLTLFLTSIIIAGCGDNTLVSDTATVLVPPQGISLIAMNNKVYITWNYNYFTDVVGYNVYVSSSYTGTYTKIGYTSKNEFYDTGALNGTTYYYAVTAYNEYGNESNLSVENVSATPRPETLNLTLYDYRTNPNRAGYDLSANQIVAYDNQYADIYFEYYNGLCYMNVFKDSDIQDMGYTSNFDEIINSPTQGWSPTKDVILIVGHTYTIWTWDNHYAKIRIKELYTDRVVLDCSYQLQKGNPQVKRSANKQERIISSIEAATK
jgi:hypothetical protein